MIDLKILSTFLACMDFIGLGVDLYVNKAFWQSEELCLDEGDVDEEIDHCLKMANIIRKRSIGSVFVACLILLILLLKTFQA
ncbi:hypothetical protein [Acinetobacter shaoyimingii]|uniref:Uncharacterized protein n=1 Tax=Acinetobacter shaoyimingii TaxID=2715164 RepID=A0A6G8RT69_9GAMM|nr:hypothetical protein [Acinetobacter shaoyimingii]QIO05104.1 hypothetical protein G8E00_03525 [Acinetobacter shaoyimingii]